MEYICVLYATYSDDTAEKKGMYTYTSSDEAVAAAHKYMGSYMNQSNVASVMCMAIDYTGKTYALFRWERKTESTT